jgi:hypothetical protein
MALTLQSSQVEIIFNEFLIARPVGTGFMGKGGRDRGRRRKGKEGKKDDACLPHKSIHGPGRGRTKLSNST